jgi:dGTPase
MPRRRFDLERSESRHLAAGAQSSADSRGRAHEEEGHKFRTAFQRDRDRIVHSRSFRRLEYKTQVFLNGTGDHYRTRMTHTMEVSCIARTIVRALGLNEDLAEAIALAHDLGHPPFGHLGETTLNRLMAGHGGFRHNAQSLRVVEELELKYPEFNGLNLSWEVREGLRKPYRAGELVADFIQPSLEAQVVDIADEIAYICHDLDDGLDSGLIHEQELRALELWRTTQEKALATYPHLEPERGRNYTLRCLLGRLADDVIAFSDAAIKQQRRCATSPGPDRVLARHGASCARTAHLSLQPALPSPRHRRDQPPLGRRAHAALRAARRSSAPAQPAVRDAREEGRRPPRHLRLPCLPDRPPSLRPAPKTHRRPALD